jgi:hypothetical protein
MKTVIAAAAAIALLAGAGSASAQIYSYSPMNPAPAQQPAPPLMPTNQIQDQALAPWMQDDGSSSDHPIHNPGDYSANSLNSEYQGGIPVAPPNGFPAPYMIR